MIPDRWRRITEVFHLARGRNVAQRTALLDEACAGDSAPTCRQRRPHSAAVNPALLWQAKWQDSGSFRMRLASSHTSSANLIGSGEIPNVFLKVADSRLSEQCK
jgi:hypothetical protein